MTEENGSSFGKKRTHPSYGIITIDRASYGRGLSDKDNMCLFGSSIRHTSFIEIRIHRASLTRYIHHDDILEDGPSIVSIEMSPSQFADAITSLNTQGTPCTIRYVDGHPVEEPPFDNKRVQFDDEFDDQMRKIASETNKYYSKIKEILSKPNIGKHDREEILSQLRLLKQEIVSNVPYIKTSFTEQMDQTVVEAKGEFDAHVEERLKALGLEKFKDKLSLDYLPELEKGERDERKN